MILSELKTNINNKCKINLPLVFINDNNDYLIKTYINQIAKNNHLTIKELSSINEMIDIESGMFKDADSLYTYEIKKDEDILLIIDSFCGLVKKKSLSFNEK